MEKLTYDEIRKHPFLEWIFIHAITKKDIIKEIVNNKNESGGYDIEFKVNGIELPLIETFKDIEKQDERRIHKEAIKIIKKKFSEIDDLLSELSENAINIYKEKLNLTYSHD